MPQRRPSTRKMSLLSPSEWKVFWIISQRPPLTHAEIRREFDRSDPENSSSDNTVRTFVKRLMDKGFINSVAGDRLSFEPSVPYDVALRFHVVRFLDQFALGGLKDLDTVHKVVEERFTEAPPQA